MPRPSSLRLSGAAAAQGLERAASNAPDWNSRAALQQFLGPGLQPLGYLAGEYFAFYAAGSDSGASVLRRSVVLLREPATLTTFDIVSADADSALEWQLEPGSASVRVLPLASAVPPLGGGAAARLHLLSLGDAPRPSAIDSLDFAGWSAAGHAVLFHADTQSARSAVSFEFAASGEQQLLITGLAPGRWDVWRNGWLERMDEIVPPDAGALAFRGRSGSYFLRRSG